MRRVTRVLLSLAWFAAISLVATPAPSRAAEEAPPVPGPCFYYHGVYICP